MPKASEVAKELRKLADGFDREPDAEIIKPFIFFSHYGIAEKNSFLAVAKALPKPAMKEYKDKEIRLEYKTSAVDILSKIDRDAVCHIVEPAKPAVYSCEPILSQIEEESLV